MTDPACSVYVNCPRIVFQKFNLPAELQHSIWKFFLSKIGTFQLTLEKILKRFLNFSHSSNAALMTDPACSVYVNCPRIVFQSFNLPAELQHSIWKFFLSKIRTFQITLEKILKRFLNFSRSSNAALMTYPACSVYVNCPRIVFQRFNLPAELQHSA